jgi:hypothetical protein
MNNVRDVSTYHPKIAGHITITNNWTSRRYEYAKTQMDGILTYIAYSPSTMEASRRMQRRRGKEETRRGEREERCEREMLDAPAIIYVISSGA